MKLLETFYLGRKMFMPMVSILWINYNSMHIINIIKESLNSLIHLEYPSYEIIVVDNGSIDGSREAIEEHLKFVGSMQKVKFIKLKRNLGFTGGVNAAYRLRNAESKYVAIVNNDAIPYPDYLRKLVFFMERHDDVGAVQGIVLKMSDTSKIDSAGMFIDDTINVYSPFSGKYADILCKPIYVSYVEGTMPLYRVDSIKRSLKDNNTMYITAGFAYYLEDVFLSLMFWNQGYRCVVLPVITGEHYREATTKKFASQIGLSYYALRNRIALLYMTNSKKKKKVFLKYLRRLFISKGNFQKRKIILNALLDGIHLGKELIRKYGIIDIYKAKLFRIPYD
jgi:GT2 family glycosyltransferase